MSRRQHIMEGRKALPIALIGQVIRKLTRHELEAVTERLIERLDEISGDPDLEDNGDQEDIDEREPEYEGGAGFWDIDQRFSIMDGAYMHIRSNVDDYPFR